MSPPGNSRVCEDAGLFCVRLALVLALWINNEKFLNAIAEIWQQTPDRICETGSSVIPQDALGCYDEEYLYLLPTPSCKAIQAQSKVTGGVSPVGDKTLWKHLRAEGIIETSDTRSRNTVQLRFNCFAGKNVDVLKIDRKHFVIAE